jgi:hypothetical protein
MQYPRSAGSVLTPVLRGVNYHEIGEIIGIAVTIPSPEWSVQRFWP